MCSLYAMICGAAPGWVLGGGGVWMPGGVASGFFVPGSSWNP